MTHLQEVSEKMCAATDLDDLWNIAHQELEKLGVAGIFYGILASSHEASSSARKHDLPMPRGLLSKTSYSNEFLRAFKGQELVENDPTVTHCLINNDVLVWGYDEVWAEHHPWYRQRYEIEREFGYHKGCSIPSSYFSEKWVGGMGLAMPDVPEEELHAFWQSNSKQILDICGLLESGIRNIHPEQFVGLTVREKESLTWLSAGYTPQEISLLMKISTGRVEKLMAQAKRKLSARTRDHAVARAIFLKIIEP